MADSPPLGALGGWPAVLGRLTRRQDLSRDEAAAALSEVLEGNATPAQIAAFCIGLRIKGETVEEMAALLATLQAYATPVPLTGDRPVVDTCGTGGDRSHTINVSTLAALVVAGAGVPVCKHGNRAASSHCGSADVLEALGVAVDLGPEAVAACIAQAGMGFCFAPRFHSALRHAGPTRRELGVPTVFNFLGPLANPGRVRRQTLGVSDPSMAERMVGVLAANGCERALVVYGHDGLDELSTTTTSTVLDLEGGAVRAYVVDPAHVGLPHAEVASLRGGDATANAEMARRVLDGEKGPHRDIVVLNAAAGIMVGGAADSLAGGVEAATAAIDDGRAAGVLDDLVRVSNEVAG